MFSFVFVEEHAMEKPLKVGIVGYGQMGSMWASVLSTMPEVELAVIADPDASRRKDARFLHSVPLYRSGLEMLKCITELDVVVIATHVRDHDQQVMSALQCGCHVICEKPMALTLRQCDMMVLEAERQGLKLAINHQSIFSRVILVAEQKIVVGDIGKLYAIKVYGKGRPACSDLMEIAGHLLHLMWYFAGGKATKVYGDVTINGRPVTLDDVAPVLQIYPQGRDSGFGAGDCAFGHFTFSSGIRGYLHLDMLEGAPDTFGEKLGQSRNYGYYLELMGTKGRMKLYLPRVLSYNSSPLDDFPKNNTPWQEIDPALREERDPVLMRRLAKDFLRAIRENEDPVVSGKVGRMVMDMTLGVYASHLAGRPMALPLVDRRHPFHASKFYVD